ncbi:TetR/AcrR family transcriptional regulator [Sphingomonas mucosissima]|uniref:HTH-type transcriptional regulator EthR n=1 Tax=Sphingomonas mucosissima TaxID=370959 RepID=A0A245ZQM5_9SPHN|nr:TetR family transcriptional regulator [Sphingomonas mucosissima]OWK32021.1 HTH-type transcriptional regulator EthR [Sphingomonas mucosissima]
MEFQRARNEAQRDQRRNTILTTAAAMLKEMPVADVSLNELSRRVGLAKSNVRRYFESREAVLLELLNDEVERWIADVDLAIVDIDTSRPAINRANTFAATLALTLDSLPILCDLISAQASVLERNVSAEVILSHRRAFNARVQRLSGLLLHSLPELRTADVSHIISSTFLMVAGAWPHGQPSKEVLAAYQADPAIGATSIEFISFLQDSIALTIIGLLTRSTMERHYPSPSLQKTARLLL